MCLLVFITAMQSHPINPLIKFSISNLPTDKTSSVCFCNALEVWFPDLPPSEEDPGWAHIETDLENEKAKVCVAEKDEVQQAIENENDLTQHGPDSKPISKRKKSLRDYFQD